MRFLALPLLFASSVLADSQAPATPILIDGATAKQHLLASPGPFIPPIAKAAHMFADVQLQLWIDPVGHVSAVTVLSGPLMLEGAAIESAQGWLYQPFLKEGQPVAATTVITFKYNSDSPLPKTFEKPLPSAFSEAQIACVEALQAKPNPDKQAKACGKAASMAETLPAGFYTAAAQRTAYLRAANSLLLDKQYKQALVFADQAVALAESGKDDMDGACKAYAVRAEVESELNDLVASDRAYTIAEEYEDAAIQIIQSDKLKAQYTHLLQSILRLHADLLTAAGKPAEAQAKAQEAAKL